MERMSCDTLKEAWGEYRMPDGLLVRLRGQVVFAWREGGKPEKHQIRTAVTVASAAPPELTGDPSTRSVDFEKDEPAARYTDWKTVSEAESLYLMPNGSILLIRIAPTEIRRFPKYNADREPIVHVLHSMEMVATPSLYGDAQPREIQAGAARKLAGM